MGTVVSLSSWEGVDITAFRGHPTGSPSVTRQCTVWPGKNIFFSTLLVFRLLWKIKGAGSTKQL